MNKSLNLTFLTLLGITLILTGCQSQSPPTQIPPTPTEVVSLAAQPTATTPLDTPTPEPSPTAVPTNTPLPTAENTSTPSATPTIMSTPTEAPPSFPKPALFDTPWLDRSPFQAGLITARQSILEELPGATVYHIDMRIDDSLLQIAGREEVLYTNREDEPLNEIYFRLFPNIAGGKTAIADLTINDEPVEPTFELQNSAMRVPLDAPLLPGEAVVIRMAFEVTVPDGEGGNYGTFAFVNDVLALAHFYPLIAVYDNEGWNIEVAPSIGDVIYAEDSFYLVRVNAPIAQRVLASGVEIDRQETDERRILTLAAGPVRDFYIAASDSYAMISTIVGETTINSYAPADLAEGSEMALKQAADAIESFNGQFGLYPYTEFDMVSTTTFALGIEYPGIVAILVDLYDPNGQVAGTPAPRLLEAVVAHEVAHQWFYGVVGNDQVDEPWLDEALAQFATLVYYSDVYGPNGAAGFHSSLERRWQRVDGADIPIGLPVRDYSPQEYGAIVYGRGPLFIEALSLEMGMENFGQFLKDYYQTNAWQIATGEDFKTLAEQHCECDLTALFEAWVFEKKG